MTSKTLLRPSRRDVSRYGRKEEAPAAGSVAEMIATLKGMSNDMAKKDKEIAEFAGTATEQIKQMGTIVTETKAALEKSVAEGLELQKRYTALEQLVATLKDRQPGLEARKSLGMRAVESDEFKAVAEKGESWKGRATFSAKTITSETGTSGAAGDFIIPQRIPDVVVAPNRPLVVRDLLGAGTTSSSSLDWVQETGFTNNAAPVAEGAQKPESNITFELQTTGVKTIAHWIMATKQVLADVPMLMSYIDGRLRYGLALVEEDQILRGDGTGQNLHGLIPQATAYDTNRSKVGDTRIDRIRRAMTQVRLAQYRATGILMHPSDWEEIELTKSTTHEYIWANPNGLLGPTLWGLPVIDTTALEEGEFLVGSFKQAATVWDREQSVVDVSTEDRDNFIKNMVTIRAEERLALTVFRPEAIVYGDFDTDVSGG